MNITWSYSEEGRGLDTADWGMAFARATLGFRVGDDPDVEHKDQINDTDNEYDRHKDLTYDEPDWKKMV